MFEGGLEIFNADLRFNIFSHFGHGCLNVNQIGLFTHLLGDLLLVGLGWQNLLHFSNAFALRFDDVTGCFKRELNYIIDTVPLVFGLPIVIQS